MVNGSSKSLGILLSRGPASSEVELIRGLARASVGRSIRVSLFLMAEGADLLGTAVVRELLEFGVRVSVCTQSARERDLPLDLEFVDYSSQFQLGRLVALADRFVSIA